MTHHAEWEKVCQNWKRRGSKNLGRRHSVFCWHSFIHWEFLPEGQTIKAVYWKRYRIALKKNELSDANPDPINNWFFLHNNSPSCNVAIMGSFWLAGWLPSFVSHPICLTLLQLTLVSFLNSDLPWKVCTYGPDVVTMVLNSIWKEAFLEGIKKVYERASTSANLDRGYTEKQFFSVSAIFSQLLS